MAAAMPGLSVVPGLFPFGFGRRHHIGGDGYRLVGADEFGTFVMVDLETRKCDVPDCRRKRGKKGM